MKLNGSPSQHPTPKLKAKSPQTDNLKELEKTAKAVLDTSSADPLANSFELLAAHDRKAPLLEASRLRKNLEGKYEALVDFKTSQDKSFVLSVRKEEEIPLYAALLSGGPVDPDLDKMHKALQAAQAEDSKFYLERQGEYLRSDAAGAAIVLKRGSRLVLRRSDGEFETHTSSDKALDFLSRSNSQAAAARKEIELAKEAGLTLAVPTEAKPGEEKPSPLKMILSMFDKSSELEIERDLAKALQNSGRVEVGFEKDERPIALPLTLNQEEMKLASQWKSSPPADIKSFQDSFKALSDDKSIFMTQQPGGPMKGMVLRADDRAAYFQLRQGERLVVLDKAGDLHELRSLEDFRKFQETGRVKEPDTTPFDGSKANSDNLLMVYHVSPFDPLEKGNYDDLPQRVTALGSSPQVDIVTMRSDLPSKRNLRVDRVQKGELQELKRLDPKTAMSDPKILEDFIYETVSSNLGDEKIRFLVGGHGGAEKGLLPDGEHNNAAADEAMPVDKFAGAISKALDRVEKESGKRPKIDNLMLVSCLMGNTSFIHALAQTGDIETLIASPELMAGSNPLSTFEYLADPKTSKASGLEYAEHLLNEWSQAPAMIGGSLEHRHADTIGAYDLSPAKAKRFQKALGGFFEAALAEPKYAEYLKENINKAPSYGINPLINIMFDVDNRDLLQVLDHAVKDARINSPKLKQAMAELREATESQVIDQKVSENYQGRRGPSLYLPLDEWDFNEKMAGTELLQGVKYKEFMKMIFEAPLQRGVASNMLNELSRLSKSGALDKAFEKLKEAAGGKGEATETSETGEAKEKDSKSTTKDVLKSISEAVNSEEAKALKDLHGLEEFDNSIGRKAFTLLKGVVNTAVGVAGGLVGGALGAGLGTLTGAVLGARAGWTGVSAAGTHKPASEQELEIVSKVLDELLEANGLGESKDSKTTEATRESNEKKRAEPKSDSPDLSPLKGLFSGRVAKGIKQLFLWPSESRAIKIHEAAGRKLGELPGRVIGALTGAVTGALTTALTAGGIAFVGAGLLSASVADSQLDKLGPGEPEKGNSLFLGRFEPAG